METTKSNIKIKQAWTEMLGAHDWSFFLTPTTSYELTLKSARRSAERFFERVKYLGGKMMFWVAERFPNKPGFHLHILLSCSNQIWPALLAKQWQAVSGGMPLGQNNRIDIKTYDPRKGATYYVSKQIASKYSDYDIIF